MPCLLALLCDASMEKNLAEIASQELIKNKTRNPWEVGPESVGEIAHLYVYNSDKRKARVLGKTPLSGLNRRETGVVLRRKCGEVDPGRGRHYGGGELPGSFPRRLHHVLRL